MNALKYIPLENLSSPKFDHRLTPDSTTDDALRDSIKELGILEPLIVKTSISGFEIVAGNRRFTEAKRAGLSSAPCIVIKRDDAACEKIKLHENAKRRDLSHIDQAYTFAHLIKEYNLTESQVAVMAGYSIGYVSQHLALLSADETLISLVQEEKINFSVARELLSCKDTDERSRLTNYAAENGASVETVHNWVRESNKEMGYSKPDKDLPGNPVLPDTPDSPLYPCSICKTAIDIPKIKIVRLCPDCHSVFFHEIAMSKMNGRIEKHQHP